VADFVTGEWLGMKAVYDAIEKVGTQADAGAREIVAKSAAVMEAAAKANFSGSHKKGQPHVGGEQPNIVTGSLRRSIRSDPLTRYGPGDYGTRVGPRMIYGRRVELGLGGKGAYPFFNPAAKSSQPKFEAIAAEVWRKFLFQH
jgi:hypothetical protein